MNGHVRHRMINALIWCGALAYVVHRIPNDWGWDYVGDIGLVLLLCWMIIAQVAGAAREANEP